jgi:alkanesulfonate monooxygenase SsuD/methylene tetrahydromethanopterin reductase-like flavin-dependent oxidoreductase (luciferase family)
MKFGVLYDFRNPLRTEWFTPWPEFYSNAFAHMQEVERLGFHSVSLCEHHGDPDGYNPGIAVTMTAAAMRTERVRIQSNIIQLPFYHPVLLAEQLAVLDIISGGRLDVGIGQVGPTFDMEFGMLGLNPKCRPSLLEDGLNVLLRAWTENEPFDYQGKHWQLQEVWINPKPLQQPHPPTFVVAPFSEPAMARVARFGLDVGAIGGFFAGLTAGPIWSRWLDSWRSVCEENGRDPRRIKVKTFGSCYVTDDPEKAWAQHREGIFHSFHYERQGIHPYSSLMMDSIPQKPEHIPNWERIFLTPEEAIAELRETFAESAPDELHLMATKAGMSWEQSAEYLANFAEKVLPAVEDL